MPDTVREPCTATLAHHRNVCGNGVRLYNRTFASTIAFPGDKTDTYHALHSQHGVMFAEPHRAAPVGMLFNRGMDRHVG